MVKQTLLKKLFSDVVKQTLLKSIPIHSLNLLNFVYTVVFDDETALEDVKLAILERLELPIFFHPFRTMVDAILRNFPEKYFLIFSKNHNVINVIHNDNVGCPISH